jgi:hypothetical protein
MTKWPDIPTNLQWSPDTGFGETWDQNLRHYLIHDDIIRNFVIKPTKLLLKCVFLFFIIHRKSYNSASDNYAEFHIYDTDFTMYFHVLDKRTAEYRTGSSS